MNKKRIKKIPIVCRSCHVRVNKIGIKKGLRIKGFCISVRKSIKIFYYRC